MKGFNSLRHFAREIFAEEVTDDEIKAVYTRDGVFLDDLPFSAQTHIWRARSLFNKVDDRYKIDVDLVKTHTGESPEQLTKDDMKIIKPVFTNSPISSRKKGYQKDQIIIKERPFEFYNSIKSKIDQSDRKCDDIRLNIRNAWSHLEEFFPREIPVYKSRPFIHYPNFISLQMIEESVKPITRCPSTLKKKIKIDQKIKNPFVKKFPLVVTKEEVDETIQLFLDKFDFKKNFKLSSQQINNLKNGIMTMGFVPRLFYHCVKYVHSIFVIDEENLHDYLRIRAIWMILNARFKENEIVYLSPIIVLLKVCSVLIFYGKSPKNGIENSKDMEATVFNFIDKMMNPYKIFDPMTDEPRTIHGPKKIKIPERKSLEDIIKLVDMDVLNEVDTLIAKTMLNKNAAYDLTYILNNETWGDVISSEEEERTERDDSLSLPIQKIIQKEIAELNWTVPHSVSPWIDESRDVRDSAHSQLISSPYSLTPSQVIPSSPSKSSLHPFYLTKNGSNSSNSLKSSRY